MHDVNACGPRRGEIVPHACAPAGADADLTIGGPFASGARVVQPRGGRSTRYRTPDGAACRSRVKSDSDRRAWRAARRPARSSLPRPGPRTRRTAPRGAGPSVRPSLAVTARRTAGPRLSGPPRRGFERGRGARAVAPRSSQNGARPRLGQGALASTARAGRLRKSLCEDALVTMGGRYFGSCPPPPASYARPRLRNDRRKRRLPTLDPSLR